MFPKTAFPDAFYEVWTMDDEYGVHLVAVLFDPQDVPWFLYNTQDPWAYTILAATH